MNAISPIRSSICLRSRGATKKGLITSTGECGTDSSAAVRKRSVGAHRSGTAARSESSSDSPLEGDGFELVWGVSCQVGILVCWRFFVRSGKAVLRPVACDQVRGARGRGQGTETVAQL